MNGTIDSIFSRIENRLTDEKKRVGDLKKRVFNCKGKVDQVKGSTKATTVFSTAKFPAAKALPLYPTLFSQVNEVICLQMTINTPLLEISNPYREIEDEVQYILTNPEDSLLQHPGLAAEVTTMLFKLNSANTHMERVEFIMEDDGLGTMPLNIPSVGSMLLFNSGINPYKEYQTLDNLVSSGR